MDETGMAATDRNIAAASRPEIIRFAHLSFSMSSSFRTCSGFHVSLFVCAWHIPSCHHGYALLSGTTPFIPSVYHPFCISQSEQAHRKVQKRKKQITGCLSEAETILPSSTRGLFLNLIRDQMLFNISLCFVSFRSAEAVDPEFPVAGPEGSPEFFQGLSECIGYIHPGHSHLFRHI